MIVYLSIYSPGIYYDFMRKLQTIQMQVHNFTMYFLRRVPYPHDFKTSTSIEYKDMIIDNQIIYTRGTDDINMGCVLKTLDGLDYVLNTHDVEWVVRTNISSYFNHKNLEEELKNLPKEPVLYGIHAGMCFGSYIVWNRQACLEIFKKATSTRSILENHVDDLALTKISHELGFLLIPRKKSSNNIYDSIWEFTGMNHFRVQDDWVMYKQKTVIDEFRDVSDIYRYTQFVKMYDPIVYKKFVQESLKETCDVLMDGKIARCSFRECEFLYNFHRTENFEYTFKIILQHLNFYTEEELHKIILWILFVYRENLELGFLYLQDVKKYLKNSPLSIRPEIWHFSFRDKWSSRLYNLFFST